MTTALLIDDRIMDALGEKPRGVSELARKLGEGRTTIAYRLKKLHEGGEAHQAKRGKYNAAVWELCYRPERTRAKIQVFSDRAWVRAYASLFSLPSGSVIYTVQGKQALYDGFRAIPREFIIRTRRMYKRKGIVIKGVINRNYLPVFNSIDNEMIAAHADGGGLGARTVASKKFAGAGELIATKECAIFTHPGKRRSILIKDEAMVEAFYEAMEELFDLMEKGDGVYSVDMHTVYRDVLKQRHADRLR
jgi:hypothetical protein